MSDSDEKKEETPKDKAKAQPKKPVVQLNPEEEKQERERIARYHDVLLTSSSILAGFSLNGLIGLPEVGVEGMQKLSRSLGLSYDMVVFPMVYLAMLCATISFLGVLIGIVSFRLQSREQSLIFLKFSFTTSVLVFGAGIGSLLTATVTMGIPSSNGFYIGLCGGILIVCIMFYRAFFLQADIRRSEEK